MLTFLTYEVLKHPDVLLKLRAEIDEVLGDRPITLNDISKMPYTIAVLREILRIQPPAAARTVHCLEPTTIGNGKYAITPDDNIIINAISTNRDPAVWGDDVCSSHFFRPSQLMRSTRRTSSNRRGCWMVNLRRCRYVTWVVPLLPELADTISALY